MYSGRVSENAAAGTLVSLVDAEQISVLDDDQGPNAQFSVRLTGPAASWFSVSPNSVTRDAFLSIKVKDGAGLDYEQQRNISLTV